MYVLGISCYYHDASACLVKDGVLVAAAEEERFSRIKHDTSFPLHAIKYCLQEAGIDITQVGHVGFYEKPLLKFERLLHQHLHAFPSSLPTFIKAMPSWLNEKLRLPRTLKKKLGYTGPVLFIEHHLAHAASVYLVSPFTSAAILTVDGVGEWATTTYGKAAGTDITLLKELRFPHSIGLLYSTLTAHLGFSVNNSEYKVMGLAPYGTPTYYDDLRKLIDIKEDGSYRLDMSYFVYHYKGTMPSRKFIEVFGPVRKPSEEVTQRHKDLASSLQKLTEDVMVGMLDHIHDVTGEKNLCMAGGVALNSVCNGKILSRTKFKDVYIQPAAGDGGTSVGVAFYIHNCVLKQPRRYVMRDAYLGPGYTAAEIRKFLDEQGVTYTTFKNDDELVKRTAAMINDNNVIGWFQGRMEWGPRALGARSILSNPCNPKMQDILNVKVKHRERFRPFAPVVAVEDALTYFECDKPIPLPTDFMLMVYPIVPAARKKIPAVTHVDGSGRLQTIRKEQNPRYWGVVKEFGKRSGVPILINTSFNIRGEPIVCTPEHAYRCMMGTGIDYLVMDRFLIKREDNPQHMWDSESIATD